MHRPHCDNLVTRAANKARPCGQPLLMDAGSAVPSSQSLLPAESNPSLRSALYIRVSSEEQAKEHRRWNHRIANVLATLPKGAQPEATALPTRVSEVPARRVAKI